MKFGEFTMDRYDPNQWTKAFAAENEAFCIGQLKGFNDQVIHWLELGNHEAVVVGLDRILNGLVTMIQAGYDCRSHACFFSWVEANVLLFGDFQGATEQNRLQTAEKALLDARDFAKSADAKNNISLMINDIQKGYDLSALAKKYADAFPQNELELLHDLNRRLAPSPVPAISASPATRKKKPWWLIFVLLIAGAFVITLLMNKASEPQSPADENRIPATQQSVQTTTTEPEITTEIVTEPLTESTVDAEEEVRKNIIGTWIHVEIREGELNPFGEPLPAILTEVSYTFYEDGRYSVSDGTYEEASENEQAYAELKEDRYWICVGGGGRSGNYTINANQITFVTEESVQYGPSETSTAPFTMDGDTLVLEHPYGTTVYQRAVD